MGSITVRLAIEIHHFGLRVFFLNLSPKVASFVATDAVSLIFVFA